MYMQNWRLMRDGKVDKDTFVLRAQILDHIRAWFKREGFLEVVMQFIFKTSQESVDTKALMTTGSAFDTF